MASKQNHPSCRGRKHDHMEVIEKFEYMTDVAEHRYEVRRCRDCGFEDKFCVEIRPHITARGVEQ